MAANQQGNGAMNFYLSDLYPGMSFNNTRYSTVPEESDQQSLVDDDKNETPIKQDPVKSKNIWVSLLIILAVIIVFSIKF